MVKLYSNFFSVFSSPKQLITFGRIIKALRQHFFRIHILYIWLSSLKKKTIFRSVQKSFKFQYTAKKRFWPLHHSTFWHQCAVVTATVIMYVRNFQSKNRSHSCSIDLFASLSRRDMDTWNEGTFVSLTEAPPVRRRGKGYGDENEYVTHTTWSLVTTL